MKVNYYDKRLLLFLASPFIAGVVLVFIASSVKFGPVLYPPEMEILAFTPGSVDIIERQPIFVTGVLESPLRISTVTTRRDFIAPKLSTTPEIPSPEKKVSFILIKRDIRMAIINGLVLKEGDTISDSMVVRIERDRVLIREKGGGKRWLEIE